MMSRKKRLKHNRRILSKRGVKMPKREKFSLLRSRKEYGPAAQVVAGGLPGLGKRR